jgi:hypothetical protein
MVSEWTNAHDWLELVREHRSPSEIGVAKHIIAWADDRQLKHRGQGKRSDTKGVIYMPVIPSIDWDPVPFNVKSKTGHVALEGSSLKAQGRRPFGDPGRFERLLDQLRAIDGVAPDKDTYPDISLIALSDRARFDAFFGVMDNVVKQIRRSYL